MMFSFVSIVFIIEVQNVYMFNTKNNLVEIHREKNKDEKTKPPKYDVRHASVIIKKNTSE
jgi:hypothetical protein